MNCTSLRGIRFGSTTVNGKDIRQGTKNFDAIESPPAYDPKFILNNVTFAGFKQTYSGNLSACSGNKLFAIHPTSVDKIGSINVELSKC